MKRLDDMDFTEISEIYRNIFYFIDVDDFNFIKKEIEDIYSNYIKYSGTYNYKVKGGTLGRGSLKWGRNIIWGWYIEKLMYTILKRNQSIKNLNFYGADAEHKFLYDNNKKEIEIKGLKQSKPDFLIELNNSTEFCIELKTAAKNIFSIKSGNIEKLYEEAGYNNRVTLILMIDLENKLFSLQNLLYFNELKPFVNQRMEGQLCYEFPIPNQQIELLQSLDFNSFIDFSIFNVLQVKKLKSLKTAYDKEDKYWINIIKNKIKLDKLEEEKNYNIAMFNERIDKITDKFNNIKTITWEEVFIKFNV